MDASRFDALVRSLTTGLHRRTFVAALGAALAPLLGTPAATAHDSAAKCKKLKGDKKKTCLKKAKKHTAQHASEAPSTGGTGCAGDLTTCGGVCTNLQTDAANCGICGTACATGETCCNGGCNDTQTDEANCGSCDNACDAGQTCCSGVCRATQTDEANCGGCGRTCPVGQPLCCSGVCRDSQFDPAHCGSCGNNCQVQGKICCNGVCTTHMSDPGNCGRCGNVCVYPAMCFGGRCCKPGGTLCSPAGSSDPTCCSGQCRPEGFCM